MDLNRLMSIILENESPKGSFARLDVGVYGYKDLRSQHTSPTLLEGLLKEVHSVFVT